MMSQQRQPAPPIDFIDQVLLQRPYAQARAYCPQPALVTRSEKKPFREKQLPRHFFRVRWIQRPLRYAEMIHRRHHFFLLVILRTTNKMELECDLCIEQRDVRVACVSSPLRVSSVSCVCSCCVPSVIQRVLRDSACPLSPRRVLSDECSVMRVPSMIQRLCACACACAQCVLSVCALCSPAERLGELRLASCPEIAPPPVQMSAGKGERS